MKKTQVQLVLWRRPASRPVLRAVWCRSPQSGRLEMRWELVPDSPPDKAGESMLSGSEAAESPLSIARCAEPMVA